MTRPTGPSALVIGGGVIGVSTAYELQARGFAVTLLDDLPGVGLGTSRANGSLLTPSMADPWNAPGVHRHLIGSLFDPHSPMKLRLHALPSLAGWGLRFLRSANPDRYLSATRASFDLAAYSSGRLRALRQNLKLEYQASDRGTMKIFASQEAMRGPLALARMLEPRGLSFDLLDAAGAVAREPLLEPIADRIGSALYFPDDGVGDAHLYCRALLAAFVDRGGRALFGIRVTRIDERKAQTVRVETNEGVIAADHVVIAAGIAAARLSQPLGVSLSIRPVKGYTLTFDTGTLERPSMPIVDDSLHAAVVPIGDRLRVAGMAEFTGEDLTIDEGRVKALRNLVQAIYPQLALRLAECPATSWCGLRPVSADGLPFIGEIVPGIHVNAGHGHLGWTCAAGSGALLADLILGTPPGIDPAPYSVDRSRKYIPFDFLSNPSIGAGVNAAPDSRAP